jgi:hypothetical protein
MKKIVILAATSIIFIIGVSMAIESFFHLSALFFIFAGLLLSFSRFGLGEIALAVRNAFSSREDLHLEDIRKSRDILCIMARNVHIMAAMGAFVGLMECFNKITRPPEEFGKAFILLLMSAVYGLFLSNIILLNMAAYLERKELDRLY